jgi:hypothetical protein
MGKQLCFSPGFLKHLSWKSHLSPTFYKTNKFQLKMVCILLLHFFQLHINSCYIFSEKSLIQQAGRFLTANPIHGQEEDYENLNYRIKICTILLPSILQRLTQDISNNELYEKSIQELKHDVSCTLHFMSCVLFGRAVDICIRELQPK